MKLLALLTALALLAGCEPRDKDTAGHLYEVRFQSGRIDTLWVNDWYGGYYDRTTGVRVWIDHTEAIRRIK